MSNQTNGYPTGLLIILATMMLGMLLGGSLFTYSVYRKHQMALQWARVSEAEARMAVGELEARQGEQSAVMVELQELRARVEELETENAVLRDQLQKQQAD